MSVTPTHSRLLYSLQKENYRHWCMCKFYITYLLTHSSHPHSKHSLYIMHPNKNLPTIAKALLSEFHDWNFFSFLYYHWFVPMKRWKIWSHDNTNEMFLGNIGIDTIPWKSKKDFTMTRNEMRELFWCEQVEWKGNTSIIRLCYVLWCNSYEWFDGIISIIRKCAKCRIFYRQK